MGHKCLQGVLVCRYLVGSTYKLQSKLLPFGRGKIIDILLMLLTGNTILLYKGKDLFMVDLLFGWFAIGRFVYIEIIKRF